MSPVFFRKNTFSGLGTSYFSHCCKKFKLGAITTLLHRAYNVCSSYSFMHVEFCFLRNFFSANGFPSSVVDNKICSFLDNKYSKSELSPTVNKKKLYFPMHYFGHKSVTFTIDLSKLISDYFPHIDPQIILVNDFKIGSFFKFKDAIPKFLRSSIVYKFSCVQSNCTSVYYGSTIRALKTRVAEHRGTSSRTGYPLTRPPQSSVRNHCESCGVDVHIDNFQIVSGSESLVGLRIAESLLIHKFSPDLNETESAFPLKVITH